MPFRIDPNTGVWFDERVAATPNPEYPGHFMDGTTLPPGPYTGPSNDRMARDQYAGSPAPAPGFQIDPNSGQALGQAIGLPKAGSGVGASPGSQGYYGYPAPWMGGGSGYYGYPAENPFGEISRSMEEMMRQMQDGLDQQTRAMLEERQRWLSEFNQLEESKKKRRLLGAKGRAGNILSAGSGITASNSPVSRAVLY